MGIVDMLRSSKVSYTNNSTNNVKVTVDNGNSNITVRGNNVDITAGTGNQNVVVLGDDVDIKLDQNAAADWDSTQDFDIAAVISAKGCVNIDTGDGNDTAIALADNLNINMGEGTHMVGFWGDVVNMNIGDGTDPEIEDKSDENELVDLLGDNGNINVDEGNETEVEDEGDENQLVESLIDPVNINAGVGNNNIYTIDKLLGAGIINKDTTIIDEQIGKLIGRTIKNETGKDEETLSAEDSISETTKDELIEKLTNTYDIEDLARIAGMNVDEFNKFDEEGRRPEGIDINDLLYNNRAVLEGIIDRLK